MKLKLIENVLQDFKQNKIFRKEFALFQQKTKKLKRIDLNLSKNDFFQISHEKTSNTSYDKHYVYHTAWATRVLLENNTENHIDLGSDLRFITIASSFFPITFYDFRPADVRLSNLISKQGDITKLPFEDNSVKSISSMHVVEHIGLGRYGDPLDPVGDIKAMEELVRVLAPEGSLLFVVPIGKPRVCFNAHRIYNPVQILSYFSSLYLTEFAVVPDGEHLLRHQDPYCFQDQQYACGMFHFEKR